MGVADLVIYGVLAMLGVAIGWALRQSGASAREMVLKREILEAKAAVPQLESSVRNREQQVSTLESQVTSLKERIQALDATEMRDIRDFHAAARLAQERQHRGRSGTQIENDVPPGPDRPGHELLEQGRVKGRR